MANLTNTSPETVEALVAALERFLDLLLDGRMDELSEEEAEAYRMASDAIDMAHPDEPMASSNRT